MADAAEAFVWSVPARELSLGALPGSVFGVEVLRAMPLSPDLRLAVELAVRSLPPGAAPRCVARPEIFTHGRALEWLQGKLQGVTDHLHFSDGTTIKLIPGLKNHVFTYGLHGQRQQQEFKKLLRRAPELLAQCRSQVNSFHRIVAQGMAVEPKATVLMPAAPAPAGTVWSYGLYLNPHSTEDSAERMLSWGELEGLRLGEFDQVTYVPLTECAAREGGFQRLVAELVSDTFFHPKACLLIRLPPAGADLAARLRLALEGIRSSGVPLPQARSKNIVFLSDDVAEETLAPLGARLSFILHQNFEFWRYTPSLYALADKILVFLDHDWKRPTDTAKHLLREAFGQAPRFAFGARNPDGEWAGE